MVVHELSNQAQQLYWSLYADMDYTFLAVLNITLLHTIHEGDAGRTQLTQCERIHNMIHV